MKSSTCCCPNFLSPKAQTKTQTKKIRQCRMKSIITDKTSIKDVCIFLLELKTNDKFFAINIGVL